MTVPKRNVFLVANNLDELGGVQRVTHSMGTLLHEAGHNVTAIGMTRFPTPHDYGARPYRTVVINDSAEPRPPKASGLAARWDPRVRAAQRVYERAHRGAVERLSQLFREVDDGIVIVMQVWSMNWVAEARTKHLRVIGMSHESFDATLASSRWSRVKRYYRDLDLMLVLTSRDAERFELEGFNNVEVMHNPLPFYPDRVSDVSAPVVVSAGRYAPEKGYDRLIDAFSLVAPEFPEWSLRIFGSGRLQDRLVTQAQRLGIGDRVSLPGLAGDIEEEFRRSSVFALSSIHEGLPMVLAEAMACGVPGVAFDCAPGVREIVTDGVDGIVVPPRNVDALARGLTHLMGDEALRRAMGQKARENVRKFAPDAVLAQWEDVFHLVTR